jgi:hypothetical protein
MTTGDSAIIEALYGTIEFTHIKRKSADIIKSAIRVNHRPLRIATRQTAVRDLLRVGRNATMIDTGI